MTTADKTAAENAAVNPGAEGKEDMTSKSPNNRAELPEAPRTIMVVDDEHLVATGLVSDLEELGFEAVGPASDGEEAIELCRATMPDMALVDIRMPIMDGLEAADHICNQLGIPVILCTAYAAPYHVETGNKVGVHGYLLKPVTKDQLRICISVSWNRYLNEAMKSDEIERLKVRLEQRKVIEQAKWIIVQRKGITEPEAMKLLQKQARNNRRPLIDIAASVLENEPLL